MRSRFCRCRTQLIVSGKSSSLAMRAAAIFFSNDRLPAMRSLSSAIGLWIEICTWSRPADFSACARSRVKSVPAVISDEYRPASRAPAQSSTRSRRSIGSPPVSASCRTPSARASRNDAEPVLGLELVAVALAADVERVRAVRAVQRALVGELGDQRGRPRRRHRPPVLSEPRRRPARARRRGHRRRRSARESTSTISSSERSPSHSSSTSAAVALSRTAPSGTSSRCSSRTSS